MSSIATFFAHDCVRHSRNRDHWSVGVDSLGDHGKLIRTCRGFRVLDIPVRHAAAVPEIELPHSDPFDRLLAHCEVERSRLVSVDKALTGKAAVILV
jgi:hypothetical protein